jgi:NTP pyrophosphatase (non-canonical NTP hydrolase)
MKARLLYEKAISRWGYESQMRIALEEMLELSHAIMKFLRAMGDLNTDWEKMDIKVEEEIADVEIMMAQLRLVFNGKRISKIKARKLRRLQKLLEKVNDKNTN